MASLTGQQIKDTYQSLLKIGDNGQITGVSKNITDGVGSGSGLFLRSDGVVVSGSFILSGSFTSTEIINTTSSFSQTASFVATASWANNVITSSYALTASYALNGGGGGPAAPTFPYTGSAIISGSLTVIESGSIGLTVTGSVISTAGFTGSLQGTASWADNVITSSYTLTASYALSTDLPLEVFYTSSYGPQSASLEAYFPSEGTIYLVSESFSITGSGTTFIGNSGPGTLNWNYEFFVFNEAQNKWWYVYLNSIESDTLATIYGSMDDTAFSEQDQFNPPPGPWAGPTGTYKYYIGKSLATGYQSVAFGSGNVASGEGSMTLAGYTNRAIGGSSIAFGGQNISIGGSSLVHGFSNVSYGQGSHAEGYGTRSSGSYSHTEGFGTIAIGNYSHAEGYFTVASGAYQHVQGQYNQSSSAQSAFIIGNGTSQANRSNLVFASGSQFQVTGSVISTAGFTGSLQGTASWANNVTTSSYALTASYALNGGGGGGAGFPYSGDAEITGSLKVLGSGSVLGTELVTNGGFIGNTDGWVTGSDVTYGTNDVVVVNNTNEPYLSTQVNTVSGTTYTVSFKLSNVQGDSVYFYFNNNTFYYNAGVLDGIHQFSFVSDYTGTDDLYLDAFNYTPGAQYTLTDVSMREGEVKNSIEAYDEKDNKVLDVEGQGRGTVKLGTLSGAGTQAGLSNFVGYQAGYSASNAQYSNFFGPLAGAHGIDAYNSNFLGQQAGYLAISAYASNFLGYNAGYSASNAAGSNFLGSGAGNRATNAENSNFFGNSSGFSATNANGSNFIGFSAGNAATNAQYSNFLGTAAGSEATNAALSNFLGGSAGSQATNAQYSNFLGSGTGYRAVSASYSTLIGYQAGYASNASLSIGPNNIVIGTNITLEANRRDSINLGAIIFATGSYSTTTSGAPFSGTVGNGRVGINVVNPTQALEVSGSVQISQVLVLPPQDPLPSGQPTGSFAVSGSGVDCKPYFWNGATWTALF